MVVVAVYTTNYFAKVNEKMAEFLLQEILALVFLAELHFKKCSDIKELGGQW